MRYRLRTLMIVLALIPALAASGYWEWVSRTKERTFVARRSILDGSYALPDNKPGYHWEFNKEGRFVEVRDILRSPLRRLPVALACVSLLVATGLWAYGKIRR